MDASGNVYVLAPDNFRIQKFDSDGTFLTKWGSFGTGDGQFTSLRAIAVDTSDNVYVAELNRHRIQKFDSDGTFLTKWDAPPTGSWGRTGGIAADADGNVYVADLVNRRIHKFDSEGTFLTKWGSEGTGDGQFSRGVYGLGVDADGNVYVTDDQNHRVQKFDSDGTFLTQWGSYGTGDGQFAYPMDVAVDADGNVYVADQVNHRIQKFAPPVLDAPTSIEALIQDVLDLNTANGISNSLDAKLDNAFDALTDTIDGNDGAAVNMLQAFIYSASAQAGKKITEAQADELIAAAAHIIELLEGA